MNRKAVMSGLEWLAMGDWREYNSDSEVQSIAKGALEFLKEQEPITCSHCANWIPGKGTDDFHFIPPGCKRHGGMWPGDGFCSYAERR